MDLQGKIYKHVAIEAVDAEGDGDVLFPARKDALVTSCCVTPVTGVTVDDRRAV